MHTETVTSQPAAQTSVGSEGPFGSHYEKFRDCVHCGLCLPACPTYAETGLEMSSPRGRIYLMRAYAEGRIGITDNLETHVYECLDCRACETACPAGVQYGSLVELARSEIESKRPRPRLERLLRRLVFRHLLPSSQMLDLAFLPLRLYQKFGIRKLLQSTRLIDLLPARLRSMENMLPRLPRRGLKRKLSSFVPAQGEKRYRVGLVSGCVMNEMFTDVHAATINVLTKNGCEIVIPDAQTCCGALHIHSGERSLAEDLARRNILAFEGEELDAVIINAAGCGAQLKEYGELLHGDAAFSERAHTFSGQVRDISEFLGDIELNDDLGRVEKRVAYHDACHLAHGQQVRAQPRALLSRIPGVELVEIAESDWCCGSAGIYNLTHPEMADRLLDRKVRHINRVSPEIVATGNPGCMLQIKLGMQREGLDVDVVHPVQLLDRAYQASMGK